MIKLPSELYNKVHEQLAMLWSGEGHTIRNPVDLLVNTIYVLGIRLRNYERTIPCRALYSKNNLTKPTTSYILRGVDKMGWPIVTVEQK